ncbi:YkgJ family cysteine cluster protein [Pseudodesulfovibrio senegalensis]|nr:YkgJ family cysteine cluster protein [Pseudodesulfovibrio senegalensis]
MARTLRHSPEIHEVAQAMARANQLFDETMESQPFAPPMACKAGCIHCCYNPIMLSQPEAILLGQHLGSNLSDAQLKTIAHKARGIAMRIKGLTTEEIGKIRHELPCPLLMDGTCGIHPARPLVCRGWNSVDASQCEASNIHGPETLIESYEWPRTLAEAIQNGILRAAKTNGNEVGFLRLPNVLLVMLDIGPEQCARAWLRGEAFFGRYRNK